MPPEPDALARARLYLLLTRSLCRRPPLETLRAAVAGGCDLVQVREPGMAAGALVEWVRSVRGVAAELGVPVIVNDRPDVAVIAEADGVHLGQQDLRPEDVRERLGARLLVGLSTHSRADVESAAALAADYLGLGPVFDTATKGLAGRGLDLVRDALPRARRPAFAIGGITAANVPALRAAGAGRIAVSQAICAAADPQAAAAELAALLGP